MSYPRGVLKELATSSRADGAVTTIPTLSDLPPELILRIASLLEVRDLLALRRSYRFAHGVTQDKLLWRGILRDLRLPLPRVLRSDHRDNLSYPELEKAVLHSHMTEHRWLKRRDPGLTLFTGERRPRIHLLHILDDRWVIIIPETGSPAIWDTQEDPPKSYKLSGPMSHAFQDGTTYALAADSHQGDIIIGLWEVHTPQTLQLHLAEPRNDSFRLTACAAIDRLNSRIVALEPSRNAVITESPHVGIQIGDWARNRIVEISTSGLNDDDEFEPLLGLRLVGDYILLVRPAWIELLHVPPFLDADGQPTAETDNNAPKPHHFRLNHPNDSFTRASLSEPQHNPESLDDSRVVYILAKSTIAGLFYFRVTIHNPEYAPSGPEARMDVDLVGVYEVINPQARRREKLGPCMVLSLSLGPEGKRGVLIERLLSGLAHFVVAVSFDQNSPAAVSVESGDDLRELCKIAPRIESAGDVFTVERWGQDGDVLRCTFSEATGKIVLGTRDNRIILL